jgi:hypothetical protein
MKRFAHVVQVRVTRDEWVVLQHVSAIHQCSVEELIRTELRLESVGRHRPRGRAHLKLIEGARPSAEPMSSVPQAST